MITQYDRELASRLDRDWLNRVGTAYAHAYYTNICMRIVREQNEIREQQAQVAEILEQSGLDEDGKLDTAVEIGFGQRLANLEADLTANENLLVAVGGESWIDADPGELAWANIGNPSKITRDEFENSWQKTEAGY